MGDVRALVALEPRARHQVAVRALQAQLFEVEVEAATAALALGGRVGERKLAHRPMRFTSRANIQPMPRQHSPSHTHAQGFTVASQWIT